MTDTQLYLAIGIPVVSNAIMLTLFATMFNKRLDDLRTDMNVRFSAMEALFTEKLRRVEEVVDARLKHLEER